MLIHLQACFNVSSIAKVLRENDAESCCVFNSYTSSLGLAAIAFIVRSMSCTNICKTYWGIIG